MKRIILLLLILVLMFSTTNSAFALETHLLPKLIEEFHIGTGTYYNYTYNYSGDIWNTILFVSKENKNITFSALPLKKYDKQNSVDNDIIYKLELKYVENNDPINYVLQGFDLINNASRINISSFSTYTEPTNIQTRDSVQRDLFSDMRKIYGDEYDRIIYRDSTFPNVESITIREDLFYRKKDKGSWVFKLGTPIDAIALTISKHVGLSLTLSTISLALSIYEGYTKITSNVNAYIVEAFFARRGTINGGTYAYTMAHKVYEHCGINEENNEKKAYIEPSQPKLYYQPSEAYYKDLTTQAQDTYREYQRTVTKK